MKKENAENLFFENKEFSHVNCQGIIHHTPNTSLCIKQIYIVLKFNGTASINVYYRNNLLIIGSVLFPLLKLMAKIFLKNKGRGRNFYNAKTIVDVVR